MKERLWRADAIEFDLTKNNIDSVYQSDVTNIIITVKCPEEVGGYRNVLHKVNGSFYIHGVNLPDYHSITLDAGFPDELLLDFTAYYKGGSYSTNNPLLIILTATKEGQYLLSQNGQYQPTGNTLQFTVSKTQVNNSEYYQFKQTRSPGGKFKVKSVCHGTTTLAGIT